jgi:hypothetical protein
MTGEFVDFYAKEFYVTEIFYWKRGLFETQDAFYGGIW